MLRVSCEGESRLAVGRRPARPAPLVVATPPWSRGLWGTFLPERRQPAAARPEGQPERRRAA